MAVKLRNRTLPAAVAGALVGWDMILRGHGLRPHIPFLFALLFAALALRVGWETTSLGADGAKLRQIGTVALVSAGASACSYVVFGLDEIGAVGIAQAVFMVALGLYVRFFGSQTAGELDEEAPRSPSPRRRKKKRRKKRTRDHA